MREKICVAAKCAPRREILEDIQRAGINAVELYLSEQILDKRDFIIALCRDFSFDYAVHAPTVGYNPRQLAELTQAIGAKILVCHNIYWDDEWENMAEIFKNTGIKICMENTSNIHEPLKYMRRYQAKRCLDFEHLQIQCAGIYQEAFMPFIQEAVHIHLTGYIYGTNLWHTHIHQSPGHNIMLLNLIKNSGYSGMIVSEAKQSLQTYAEFSELNKFFQQWYSKQQST